MTKNSDVSVSHSADAGAGIAAEAARLLEDLQHAINSCRGCHGDGRLQETTFDDIAFEYRPSGPTFPCHGCAKDRQTKDVLDRLLAERRALQGEIARLQGERDHFEHQWLLACGEWRTEEMLKGEAEADRADLREELAAVRRAIELWTQHPMPPDAYTLVEAVHHMGHDVRGRTDEPRRGD